MMAREYGSSYTNEPHISYAFSPIPEFNLPVVKKILSDFFLTIPEFSINFGPVKLVEKHKFFYIQVKDPRIEQLHHQLTLLLNDYRDGYLRSKDVERLKAGYYSKEQEKMINRFGYARVFHEFESHISLGNLENNKTGFDLHKIFRNLENNLFTLKKEKYLIDEVVAVYYEDSNFNENNKYIWRKNIKLQPVK